jgi:molecular chaperone GrpE
MKDEKPIENDEAVDEELIPEDGEGNVASAKDTAKDLREKLKKALAEKQEYLDGWQRSKADFINYKKREDEGRAELLKFANEDLIMQMIPVLDSFVMAFSNRETWEKVDKNWRVGVEYIYNQLIGILGQNGFKEFDPKGEKFDPVRDLAAETRPVTDANQDHTVLETIQRGYELNGKIIRPARVIIGELSDKK